MFKLVVRLFYATIIACLLSIISFSKGFIEGHAYGYGEAMSDVLLNLSTPEKYFVDNFIKKK